MTVRALWVPVSDSGENRRRDAGKMNNGVLNIKDEGVAQQLFLFIFHWKHLDTSIHLFICPTPSVSPSPSFKSVNLCTLHSLCLCNFSSLLSLFKFYCWGYSPPHSLCLLLPLCFTFNFTVFVFKIVGAHDLLAVTHYNTSTYIQYEEGHLSLFFKHLSNMYSSVVLSCRSGLGQLLN